MTFSTKMAYQTPPSYVANEPQPGPTPTMSYAQQGATNGNPGIIEKVEMYEHKLPVARARVS